MQAREDGESHFLWDLYGIAPMGYRKFMLSGEEWRRMKIPTLRTAFITRKKRGFGQIILAALFLLSVFQLSHLPAMTTNHGVIDLWRALVVGTLFLFLCLPSSGHPHSGP